MKMLRLTWFASAFAGAFFVSPLNAQTKRDTAHVAGQRVALDSITHVAQPSFTKYCRTKGAAGYVKAACALLDRMMPQLHGGETGLLVGIPDTVKPPVPPDTVKPPIPPTPTDTTCGVATCAEMPRSTPALTVPPPTRVVTVPSPGVIRSILSTITFGAVEKSDLQTALTEAQPGDEIRLANGGTYSGNFTLGAACRSGWVTITTEGAARPPTGTRVTPTWAGANKFAKIITPDFEAALRTTGATCRWAMRGIEILATHEGTGPNDIGYGIVKIGDGREVQTTIADVPREFLFEHVYVHGSTNHNNRRCLVLNATNAIVRDSWLSDCHSRGSDSQAILVWNTPGQILLENNYLEGAGENVMIGGADPASDSLTPRDVTIRRNHFYKPLAWKGTAWSIKNLFELKNARRTLVEDNVFEHSWPASQEGMAIVVKSSKDSCPDCLFEGTEDLTFRWNRINSAAVGLNIQGRDGPTNIPVTRVTATDNLFEQIGCEGRGALTMPTHDFRDVFIARSTFRQCPAIAGQKGGTAIMDYGDGLARRLEFRGNLSDHGAYGVFRSGGAIGSAALQQQVNDGSWRFVGNVLVGGVDLANNYPPGNQFLAAWPASSVAGVNLAELLRRTANVVVTP